MVNIDEDVDLVQNIIEPVINLTNQLREIVMANEVILYEYVAFDPSMQTVTYPSNTTFINLGGAEVQLQNTTKYIVVESKGTAFQYRIGETGLTVTANASGSLYCGAGNSISHKIDGGQFFKTVADA